MRASLASATSLLALLLLDGRDAHATLTLTNSPLNFGDVLVSPPSFVTISSVATVTSTTKSDVITFAAASGEYGPASTQIRTATSVSPYTATATYTFTPTVTGSVSDPIAVSGTGGSATLTLTGTGVAPIASVSSSNNYVLVGKSGADTITVSNIGNGNLAGTGSLYNLNGTISSGSSVFVGTTSTFSLTDNSKSVSSSSSATYTYTYTPTVTGVATATVKFSDGAPSTNAATSVTVSATAVAPIQSVSTTSISTLTRVATPTTSSLTVSNIGNGNLAGSGSTYNLTGSVSTALGSGFAASASNQSTINLIDSHGTGGSVSTVLAYTYTPTARGTSTTSISIGFTDGSNDGKNLSQSVAATITGSAVGPVYTSSLQGASTTNTPTKVAGGSIGSASSTINFGTLTRNSSETIYLTLANTTTDANGGNAALTNLSIEKFSIAGANASSFTVSSLSNAQTIAEGGAIVIPIQVVSGTTVGTLNSSLTIFTDESVALGGVGDTFTYSLIATVVPEPTTLAILGAGLAGLASVRRRRSV